MAAPLLTLSAVISARKLGTAVHPGQEGVEPGRVARTRIAFEHLDEFVRQRRRGPRHVRHDGFGYRQAHLRVVGVPARSDRVAGMADVPGKIVLLRDNGRVDVLEAGPVRVTHGHFHQHAIEANNRPVRHRAAVDWLFIPVAHYS
jgi:hypothetical protein